LNYGHGHFGHGQNVVLQNYSTKYQVTKIHNHENTIIQKYIDVNKSFT